MNQDNEVVLNLLERLNGELINGKSGSKTKFDKLKFIVNAIKTNNLVYLLKKVIKKYSKKPNQKIDVNDDSVYCVTNYDNLKIAIYTCITGNYDHVCEPLVIENNCDYFLFTNNKKITAKNWQIKDIPDNIKDLEKNNLINRYIKMHPHELFKDYDYAIYIDGNITIVSNVSAFCDTVSSKTGLAMHKHYSNDCVYDEMKVCQIVGKGNPFKIKKQYKQYKKEKFPKEYGMFECGVIVSKIDNNEGTDILEKWWEEYKNSLSLRDQISLPYVMWKNDYQFNDIGIIAENVHKNTKIRINSHIK